MTEYFTHKGCEYKMDTTPSNKRARISDELTVGTFVSLEDELTKTLGAVCRKHLDKATEKKKALLLRLANLEAREKKVSEQRIQLSNQFLQLQLVEANLRQREKIFELEKEKFFRGEKVSPFPLLPSIKDTHSH